MKHLSVATVIEKNKIASDVAFLVALEVDVINPATGAIVETLYMIRNTENIIFKGRTYTAVSFDLDINEEAGTTTAASINVVDFTQDLQTRMQEYGGGVGFDLRMIIINSARLNAPEELVEYFKILTASATEYLISWGIGAENPLSIRYPRRRQFQDRCSWRYKSNRCGYTGSKTTCDLSLQGDNGCAKHFNTKNFGGFPGLAQK